MEIKANSNKLLKDAKHIQFDNLSYFISYQAFLDFFSSKQELTKDDVLIGINFTYSWMPTILNIHPEFLDRSVKVLNEIKLESKQLNQEDLAILKATFNNSLVGVSKLLHFMKPQSFPIWDSRVYRYLTGEAPYNARLQKIENLIQYVQFCQNQVNQPNMGDIRNAITSRLNEAAKANNMDTSTETLTDMRILELIMFVNGKLV